MKTLLITGANGLCGDAFKCSYFPRSLCNETAFVGREYGDLTILKNVKRMYKEIAPTYVIHTAAEVGGICGNEAHHGQFFYNNILMNTYMIDQARQHNVEKMIVFSSVCVFPDGQEVKEENMHNGPVFANNFSYGYAKRMVDIQIKAYEKQYGIKNYCSIIPGNIMGENDNYNMDYGHVMPSLIHKLYLAKKNNTDFVVWGDGSSLREFLYARDVANIIIKLLKLDHLPQRLIISGPQQYSIWEMVHKLVKIADFKGNIVWDASKPNGQHSRPSNLSLLRSLFPNFIFTDIDQTLKLSYNWFVNNYPNVRM